jgi:hypothetical protein
MASSKVVWRVGSYYSWQRGVNQASAALRIAHGALSATAIDRLVEVYPLDEQGRYPAPTLAGLDESFTSRASRNSA